jgi:inward rectifier potassium channel
MSDSAPRRSFIGRLKRRRLVTRDARADIVTIGQDHVRGDAYHWLLTTRPRNFALALIAAYLGLNVVFALAYLACDDGIANARPGSFADAFFFSVQTMATIGYGRMEPVGIAANLLVTFEAGIGLFGIAVASGLMFARFTRPTAGVRFSQKAVVTNFDGRPTLMLRIANQRSDRIHEARVHLTLIRDETTAEGVRIRRLHDLPLERASTPIFTLTWTVMHTIAPTSPLYGKTAEDLTASDALLLVVFAGHHSGFYQEVHDRAAYETSDIVWGARFADLFSELPDGRTAIDFSRFDELLAGGSATPTITQ